MVLEAEFEDPTSTLSSGEDIPTLLAPGDLLPGRQADHSRPLVEEDAVEGCASVGAWTYSVTGSKEDTVTLRLRTEGAEHPDAALYQDGAGPVWRESWTAAIWSFRPRSRGRSCCWIRERCLCWLSPCAAAASSPCCWPWVSHPPPAAEKVAGSCSPVRGPLPARGLICTQRPTENRRTAAMAVLLCHSLHDLKQLGDFLPGRGVLGSLQRIAQRDQIGDPLIVRQGEILADLVLIKYCPGSLLPTPLLWAAKQNV